MLSDTSSCQLEVIQENVVPGFFLNCLQEVEIECMSASSEKCETMFLQMCILNLFAR